MKDDIWGPKDLPEDIPDYDLERLRAKEDAYFEAQGRVNPQYYDNQPLGDERMMIAPRSMMVAAMVVAVLFGLILGFATGFLWGWWFL